MISIFTKPQTSTGRGSYPAANTGKRFSFRDGKILAGVALIVVSIVAGAALLRHEDTMTTVWQANRDLSAGAMVTSEDFAPVQADLSEVESAYATEPSSGVLTRGLRAGELLPESAISSVTPVDQRLIVLPVEPLHAPDLASGDEVDVWATASETGVSALVISGVHVVAVNSDVIGAGGESGVIVAVSDRDAGKLVAAVRSGVIDVVKAPVT